MANIIIREVPEEELPEYLYFLQDEGYIAEEISDGDIV